MLRSQKKKIIRDCIDITIPDTIKTLEINGVEFSQLMTALADKNVLDNPNTDLISEEELKKACIKSIRDTVRSFIGDFSDELMINMLKTEIMNIYYKLSKPTDDLTSFLNKLKERGTDAVRSGDRVTAEMTREDIDDLKSPYYEFIDAINTAANLCSILADEDNE